MLRPMSDHPPERLTSNTETEDRSCKQCGYALRGLHPSGVCPECGFPIERSLTDDRLEHSGPDYLRSLHTGVLLIIGGMVGQLAITLLLLTVTIFVIFASFGGGGSLPRGLEVLMLIGTALGTLVTLVIVVGWWLFSAPDPAYTGRFDGSRARVVVRVSMLCVGLLTILQAVIAMASPSVRQAGMGGGFGAASIVSMGVNLLTTVAWGVGYFASMLYLRWLCPRVPDWRAHRFAKTMMWLGPLIYIVGSCLVIGPLVAMVLYVVLLNWVRADLRLIRDRHAAEGVA